MIPINLVKTITEAVKETVKGYKLKAEGQDDKYVSVYTQRIPDEALELDDDSYYPLILVSLQNITESERGTSTVKIGITMAAYGEDMGAWEDLLNIQEGIRQKLMGMTMIANRYILQFPVTWEMPEIQPYPFWFSYGSLTYTVPQMIPESVRRELVY